MAIKLKDDGQDNEDEYEDFFFVDKKIHYHTPAWKALMERLHKLSPHEQDKIRAEIRAEAKRTIESLIAKQN